MILILSIVLSVTCPMEVVLIKKKKNKTYLVFLTLLISVLLFSAWFFMKNLSNDRCHNTAKNQTSNNITTKKNTSDDQAQTKKNASDDQTQTNEDNGSTKSVKSAQKSVVGKIYVNSDNEYYEFLDKKKGVRGLLEEPEVGGDDVVQFYYTIDMETNTLKLYNYDPDKKPDGYKWEDEHVIEWSGNDLLIDDIRYAKYTPKEYSETT